LKFHDRASTECIVAAEVTSEGWDGRHENNHLVLLAVASGADDALDNCGTDSVLDGLLCIYCCCDEELIFNVNEMLAVFDSFDVGVGDRVLLIST